MSRVVGDLSQLPAAGYRLHSLWGWATLGFMAIEGTGFALAAAAYVYLMDSARQWPLEGKPPDLLWGTVNAVVHVTFVDGSEWFVDDRDWPVQPAAPKPSE